MMLEFLRGLALFASGAVAVTLLLLAWKVLRSPDLFRRRGVHVTLAVQTARDGTTRWLGTRTES